jgi:hypothetical protein
LWSKIYYSPKLPKNYKDAAEQGLKTLDLPLLPKEEIEANQNPAEADNS